MADDSVTVKGSPVRSLQKFIEKELSAEASDRVYATLPPEYERLRRPILATETVPVRVLNLLTLEASKEKGEPVEAFARRAGREAASEAIKGIYRFFALVLTPAALLSKGSQMWSSLYNRGHLQVADQTATSATIRLLDFPAEPAGCARITGWIERMAELTGVKETKVVQTKCFARGGEHCEWSVSWR